MIYNFPVLGSWFVQNHFIFVVTKKNFQKMKNFKMAGGGNCFKILHSVTNSNQYEVKTNIFENLKVACLWRYKYFHNSYSKIKK